MASSTTQTETVITLNLTKAEARYIKSMVQNALCDDELHQDRMIRADLWKALPPLEDL